MKQKIEHIIANCPLGAAQLFLSRSKAASSSDYEQKDRPTDHEAERAILWWHAGQKSFSMDEEHSDMYISVPGTVKQRAQKNVFCLPAGGRRTVAAAHSLVAKSLPVM